MVHVSLGKVVWRKKLFNQDRFGKEYLLDLHRGSRVLDYTKIMLLQHELVLAHCFMR